MFEMFWEIGFVVLLLLLVVFRSLAGWSRSRLRPSKRVSGQVLKVPRRPDPDFRPAA